MRKRLLPLVAILALILAACSSEKTATTSATSSPAADQPAAAAPSGAAQSYTGEIMDSACAAMGSHEAMMKQEGAKDAKECTLKCVAGGSKFVLFDAASKTTYQLDDQTKPKDFAGQKVKVTGTLDSSTHTIHVENIEAS
jgi:uncharacterized protein DUF5818